MSAGILPIERGIRGGFEIEAHGQQPESVSRQSFRSSKPVKRVERHQAQDPQRRLRSGRYEQWQTTQKTYDRDHARGDSAAMYSPSAWITDGWQDQRAVIDDSVAVIHSTTQLPEDTASESG